MVDDKSRKRLPPYVSYRTFRNFVDGLQQGIPARIDRSYWGDKWSGSTGTQLMSALRYLGLVDVNGIPTSRLRQLAGARGTQRSEILKQISSNAFDFILQSNFETEAATYDQLDEAFHSTYQLTGDVARKCTKFFIGLAGDAGIALSPYIMKRAGTIRTNPRTKRAAQKISIRTKKSTIIPENLEEIPEPKSWDKMLLTKFPVFDPTWPDEVKLRWFEAFDELLKRGFNSAGGK